MSISRTTGNIEGNQIDSDLHTNDTRGLPLAALFPDDAARSKALNKESVWLPHRLASGLSLHPTTILKAVAAYDRADNKTRSFVWNSRDISTRCGVKSAKSDHKVIDKLRAAKLVSAYTPGVGVPHKVTMTASPTKNNRLVLPLAAVWEHRWRNGNVAGPRYGKDTAEVVRFYLSEFKAGDWDEQYGLTNITELSIAEKARKSGLPVHAYERAWKVARRVLADEPWIQWERVIDPNTGALDVYRIVIDWRMLPQLAEPEAQTHPVESAYPHPAESAYLGDLTSAPSAGRGSALSEGGGSALSTGGGSALSAGSYKGDNPLSSSPSFAILPPQSLNSRTHSLREAATHEEAGGGGEEKTATDEQAVEPTAWQVWLTDVVDRIKAPTNSNRLAITAADVAKVEPLLRAKHDSGWRPLVLASAITRQMPTDVTNPGGLLRYRLTQLPEQESLDYVDNDTASFLRKSESRSAARYYRRTM